jgi:hypothetical protein
VRRGEIFWLTGTLFTVLLTTGLLFNFSYFDEIDLQFHDTSIAIQPVYLVFILLVIFIYAIFLIKESFAKFSNVGGLWILLISNSILIATAFYIGYVMYAVFLVSSLVELFKQAGETDVALKSFYNAMLVCGFFFLGFTFIEYHLIRKLMKLVKT